MTRVARFTEADLSRAIKAARKTNARAVVIVDGKIAIDPETKKPGETLVFPAGSVVEGPKVVL